MSAAAGLIARSSARSQPHAAVIHIDIDSFYVAAECLRRPELIGACVAVTQFNNGGFVAVSAAARAAGIRKGDGIGNAGHAAIHRYRDRPDATMAGVMRKCPSLIVLDMDAPYYRRVSLDILRAIVAAAPAGAVVAKSSIDDYYVALSETDLLNARRSPPADALWTHASILDAGVHLAGLDSKGVGKHTVRDVPMPLQTAVAVAAGIQRHLTASMRGLTCSCGVAVNKLMARLATPCWKPSGLAAVLPENIHTVLARTPILSVPGLQAGTGSSLAAAVQRFLDIPTPESCMLPDIAKLPEPELVACVGERMATFCANAARGIDTTAVRAYEPPATIISERSFNPLRSTTELRNWLSTLLEQLLDRLVDEAVENCRLPGKLQLQWRYMYGDVVSRGTTMPPVVARFLRFVCRENEFGDAPPKPTHVDADRERAVMSMVDVAGDVISREHRSKSSPVAVSDRSVPGSDSVGTGMTRLVVGATAFSVLKGGMDRFLSTTPKEPSPVSVEAASAPALRARKRPRTIPDLMPVTCPKASLSLMHDNVPADEDVVDLTDEAGVATGAMTVSSGSGPGSSICKRCGATVPASALSPHLDWHVAIDMQIGELKTRRR